MLSPRRLLLPVCRARIPERSGIGGASTPLGNLEISNLANTL